MDQVSLQVSDNTVKAMEYAFEEAKQRLTSMHQSFDPFTVTVVDEGLEVNDHPAATPTSVRESDRKSTRLNSSHRSLSRMPSSA